MQKRFLVLVVALVLSLPVLYADIGENFAKGGIGFSGGGSVFVDFNQVLNSADEYSHWRIVLEPEVDFFVADRLALYLSPWFSYDSETFDVDNVTKTTRYGAEVGLSHAFVGDPAAQRGLVPIIGAGLAVAFYPGRSGLLGGVEFDYQSQYIYLRLDVPVRLLFFLNDRVAPYVGIRPNVWYLVSAKDIYGTSFSPLSEQRLYLDATLTFGISFYVPSKKATMIGSP
jgi:hypothetical protein